MGCSSSTPALPLGDKNVSRLLGRERFHVPQLTGIRGGPDSKHQGFPEFQGKVCFRDSQNKGEYDSHAYQYATTSLPAGTTAPSAILYLAGDEDIKKAIAYAKQQRVAIAMRSGGHSYCGSSSTNGLNIQIDMSGKAFKDIDDPQKYPYTTFAYNEDSSTITVGVGLRLEDV